VFCWLHLFTELVFFKLVPIIALSLAGNAELAGVFFLIATVTATRRYLDASACFRTFGTLDGIEENNIENLYKHADRREKHNLGRICCFRTLGTLDGIEENDKHADWREKHNLGRIVGEISQGRA